MCVAHSPISNHDEYFVENLFAAPLGSQADNCITQEKYDTDGDDVNVLFGLCLDKTYFEPIETVQRSGLRANSASVLNVVPYDRRGQILRAKEVSLATSQAGRPGAVPVDFVATSGGHIELGWKNPQAITEACQMPCLNTVYSFRIKLGQFEVYPWLQTSRDVKYQWMRLQLLAIHAKFRPYGRTPLSLVKALVQ